MKFYDEDAFWGDGEEDILTVSEVLEYLTVKEQSLLLRLCNKAEKRKLKADLKQNCFHRGYDYAREVTNSYNGFSYSHKTFDDNDWEDLNFFAPDLEDLF